MQYSLQRRPNFFISLACLSFVLSPSSEAAKLTDAQDMAQGKIKDLATESSVLKGFIADEEKLSKMCRNDNEAQIHQALIRTYKRIIALNDAKTAVWEALSTLGN